MINMSMAQSPYSSHPGFGGERETEAISSVVVEWKCSGKSHIQCIQWRHTEKRISTGVVRKHWGGFA